MNFWDDRYARKLIERIVVETELVLQTPAHFGNGDGNEIIDMPLLPDPLEGKSPLLTGASIAGALRSYLQTVSSGYEVAQETHAVTCLFGGSKGDEEGEQSPLIIDDALGADAGVELRDGVGINSQSRTSEHGRLFNLEAWQAGTTFALRFELVIREPDNTEALKQALATALLGLEEGEIALGARKRRGYGKVAVSGWRVKQYNLTKPEGLIEWLEHGHERLSTAAKSSIAEALGVSLDGQADARCYFDMSATFSLDSALLIRSGKGQAQHSPDAVHLHSRQANREVHPVLSGTSLAGALRARALKISNTLGLEASLIGDLFGKTEKASRVSIQETVIENPTNSELVQNRVSIDRFTGGALDTALFNEQPIFGGEATKVRLVLRLIKPRNYEIGLLLLLLKDLWTSDLPLGGTSSIGRGRLKGKEAFFTYKDAGVEAKEWRIVQGTSGLNIEGATKDELETFVQALQKLAKGTVDEANG